MKTVVFYNGRILAQDGELPQGYVLVENGLIQRVQAGTPPSEWTNVERIDLKGNILSPGFIDLHTHGAGGCDFMDGTQQAVITAARMHLRHGTTSLCPTSMASNDEDLFRFFDCYRQAKDVRNAMPHLLGIHLEGPYFSPNQAGAQPPEYMKKPYPEHAQTVLEHAQGDVVRWSCAPEVEGVLELGSLLQEQGILASIAHSDADYALVQRAIEHGFVHLTHFYSGMSQMKRVNGRRVLGLVEAGYLCDALTVELIADGIHLPPELLRLIVKCKNHDSICLVTDSMRAAGMPEGESVLGSLKNGSRVQVRGGVAYTADGQCYAGSVATADRLVRVMTQQAGLSIWEAVCMITLNPAKLMKIDWRTGSIAEGKAADLVVFDQDIHVQNVFVNGLQVKLEWENRS